MDRDSMERLKLDRRLTGRRNWISPEELAGALEALPGALHKIARTDAAESADGGSTDRSQPRPLSPPLVAKHQRVGRVPARQRPLREMIFPNHAAVHPDPELPPLNLHLDQAIRAVRENSGDDVLRQPVLARRERPQSDH